MSRFSVYFDEDAMDAELVGALRQRRVPIITPIEENFIGKTDEEQLLRASKCQCVLYTFNVSDFYALHSRWLAGARHHAGLILAPQQRFSVGEQLRRILLLRAAKSDEAMRDRAEFSQQLGLGPGGISRPAAGWARPAFRNTASSQTAECADRRHW